MSRQKTVGTVGFRVLCEALAFEKSDVVIEGIAYYATPWLTSSAESGLGTNDPQVAIAQADTYDQALVRQQVQALLDRLGGLEDVVSSGDRVAIRSFVHR